MNIAIILPTYNEKENLISLIPALQEIFHANEHSLTIVVVDDDSPDGTADMVQDLKREQHNIHLITGEKKGLGVAYIRGMTHVLRSVQADAVIEMDADFSHKPEDIVRLIDGLNDADFVIGSRYVSGGKLPDKWSLFRRMNSKWGNVCARYIGRLREVKDCTSGFRAIRRSVLEKIDLTTLHGHGYCFQVSLLHRAMANGVQIKEIPIEFVERVRGKSKLGLFDILEFVLYVWILRFQKLVQIP